MGNQNKKHHRNNKRHKIKNSSMRVQVGSNDIYSDLKVKVEDTLGTIAHL